MAGHAVGRIAATLDRRRTGLVLWIVPSNAILSAKRSSSFVIGAAAFALRLKTASGGAVKILQKSDAFTAADVENSALRDAPDASIHGA